MFLSKRSFISCTLVLLCAALGHWYAPLYILSWWLWSLWLLCLLLDFVWLKSAYACQAERRVAERLCNGEENSVELVVVNVSKFTMRLKIVDEYPRELAQQQVTFSMFKLETGEKKTLRYVLFPQQRGCFRFGCLWGFIQSPLGLWEERRVLAREQVVKVYPIFTKLKEREFFYRSLLDIPYLKKPIRMVQNNTEFEDIRDYIRGDEFRRVNWKATARQGKLMVNHYNEERGKTIINVLDCGRSMQRYFQGQTLLDHAINAATQLSFSSMNEGNDCGLCLLQTGKSTFVPPRQQASHLGRMLEELYQLQTSYAESNFSVLPSLLSRSQLRKSLLVIYTDFYTYDSMLRQLPHLQRLSRQHTLLVVFFEDEELQDLAKVLKKTAAPEQYVHHALATDWVLQKEKIVDMFQRNGIYVLKTPVRLLTGNVLRKYFELKARANW